MLDRGFSLVEMLLALILSSMLIINIVTFYSQYHVNVIRIYQKNRLEESVNQTLIGLTKDIKRAGFLAKVDILTNYGERPIEINKANDCIIIRYDFTGIGKWRNNETKPKDSDIFAYRYKNNNLEYQTGITHCQGTGWEKLFDSREIKLTFFKIKQHPHFIEVSLSATLKKYVSITYSLTKYVKTENL